MTEKCGIRTHSEIYKTGSREYLLLFMCSTVFALRTDTRRDSTAVTGDFYHRFGILLTLNIWRDFFKVKWGIQMSESKINFCFVYHSLLINRRLLLCSLVMTKGWSVQKLFDWGRFAGKDLQHILWKKCLRSF